LKTNEISGFTFLDHLSDRQLQKNDFVPWGYLVNSCYCAFFVIGTSRIQIWAGRPAIFCVLWFPILQRSYGDDKLKQATTPSLFFPTLVTTHSKRNNHDTHTVIKYSKRFISNNFPPFHLFALVLYHSGNILIKLSVQKVRFITEK